jgi:hypothetical protein
MCGDPGQRPGEPPRSAPCRVTGAEATRHPAGHQRLRVVAQRRVASGQRSARPPAARGGRVAERLGEVGLAHAVGRGSNSLATVPRTAMRTPWRVRMWCATSSTSAVCCSSLTKPGSVQRPRSSGTSQSASPRSSRSTWWKTGCRGDSSSGATGMLERRSARVGGSARRCEWRAPVRREESDRERGGQRERGRCPSCVVRDPEAWRCCRPVHVVISVLGEFEARPHAARRNVGFRHASRWPASSVGFAAPAK